MSGLQVKNAGYFLLSIERDQAVFQSAPAGCLPGGFLDHHSGRRTYNIYADLKLQDVSVLCHDRDGQSLREDPSKA